MNRAILYAIIALLLGTTPSRSSAQTPHHEEQLQEVVVLGKQKQKSLLHRGTRMPGAVALLTPDKVGHEVGSAIAVKRPTEVKEITLDIVSNSIEGSVLSIMIYRDSTFAKVLASPLLADIPQGKKQTITIVPDRQVLLEQGRYIIAVTFAACAKEAQAQWAACNHWDDKQRYEMTKQDCMQFPLYSKKSYIRGDAGDMFEKRNLNIGMRVKGVTL